MSPEIEALTEAWVSAYNRCAEAANTGAKPDVLLALGDEVGWAERRLWAAIARALGVESSGRSGLFLPVGPATVTVRLGGVAYVVACYYRRRDYRVQHRDPVEAVRLLLSELAQAERVGEAVRSAAAAHLARIGGGA